MQVPGAPSTVSPTAKSLAIPLAALRSGAIPLQGLRPVTAPWSADSAIPAAGRLPLLAAALVVLPVFLQAPWVRLSPVSATLFTACLLTAGVLLERLQQRHWRELGVLLVGFSGSWLGGCLFWGWFRTHPVSHLPIEAFALPLALAGLNGRWRMAAAFYLASLLGTACTDLAMALTGVMRFWPTVLEVPLEQAPLLLHQAGLEVFHPLPLAWVMLLGLTLVVLGKQLWRWGAAGRIAAAALLTTLVVDGVFLAAALVSPGLSGLI